MFGYLLLSLFLYTLYKTNPDAASFRAFISDSPSPSSTSNTTQAAVFKFFSTILSTKLPIPEFKHEDFLLFSIVTLGDGSVTYLGCLSFWFVLGKVEATAGFRLDRKRGSLFRGENTGAETEMEIFEASANGERELGNKAKASRDYQTAGTYFLSAAKQFQKIGDDTNLLEAAGCYEDAYKAFQQVKQTDKALQALETAITIYELHDRQATRAARLCEQLAEQYKKVNGEHRDLKKALMMQRKASELFERESDGRALFSRISQAELTAELGQYEEAISLFDSIAAAAANDRVLNFKLKDYLFHECLCLVGLGDWIRLEKRVQYLMQLYPTFADSRECGLITKLIETKSTFDSSAYAKACQEYDQLTQLFPWQINILLKGRQGLEAEDFR